VAITKNFKQYLQKQWNSITNFDHRAKVVARLAAAHGDKETQRYFLDLIRKTLTYSPARLEAERLLETALADPLPTSLPQPEPPPKPIKYDSELARLAIAVSLVAVYRIWEVGRSMTSGTDGRGNVTKKALRATLAQFGINYSYTHLNRLLQTGEGTFWHIDSETNKIYIRSWRVVAVYLAQKAVVIAPELVETNKPGTRQMYIDPSGSLEEFEAKIYIGWLAYRENPTIARQTLATLFNRSADTIRRWEENHLKGQLTIRANYVQSPSLSYTPPPHAVAYVAKVTFNGETRLEPRYRWQMSNSYLTPLIGQHCAKGQARKVRRAVNHSLNQPVDQRRDGLPGLKLYFDSAESLRIFLKKHHQEVGYLWRGENKHGHGIFEVNNTGFGLTRKNERVDFGVERDFLRDVGWKRLPTDNFA